MNSIILFFKYQGKYFLGLFVLFVLPLFVLWQFSPYPLPMAQYIVIVAMVVFQYGFFKERKYRQSFRGRATKDLANELNRQPSNFEVSKRLDFIVSSRGFSIIFCIILIFVMMVIYGQFL